MAEYSENGLSLYFGLHEGRKADLEIVSRAAIEWVNSIRHASKMIDSDAAIRVEFVNAHEGSLSINSVLDWGETQLEQITARIKHPRLWTLAVSLAVFLIIDAGPTRDFWFGGPDQIDLSEEDRELLNQLLQQIIESEELSAVNRRFFRTVNGDPAVKSIGVCERPGDAPAFSVPSDQFAERSGLWQPDEEPQKRNSERISDVILETPNLSEADRVWRFVDKQTGVTFTAKMRDERFVQLLRQGEVHENLRLGIEMQIHIRFKEKLVDGKWISDPSTIEVMRVTLTE